MSTHIRAWLSTFTFDLKASLVVFLVSIPMALGIALASHAPVSAGLLSAIIGGIIVGMLSGAPLLVTGPSAALAVVMYGMVQQYGFAAVGTFVIGMGVLQIIFGLSRIAKLTFALSPAIVHGIVSGSGVLIALSQLYIVLGGKPQSSSWYNLIKLPHQIGMMQGLPTLLGLGTILVVILWQILPIKFLRRVPSALVGVLVGTLAAMGTDVPRISLPSDLHQLFSFPTWPVGDMGPMFSNMVTLALIASAESLISAVASDKLHAGHKAHLDQELIAQGIGNLLCGILGGLPISGAIARTKVNIDQGAKTKMATILHGIWLIVFSACFYFLLNKIPKCVLAGLLVVVGVRLVQTKPIVELRKHKELSIYLITIGGVVCFNLLAGLGLGMAAALIRLLFRLTHIKINMEQVDNHFRLHIKGPLTFVSIPKLNAWLERIPAKSSVHFQLDVDSIDHAALECLQEFRKNHEKTGGTVELDLALWTKYHTP